MGRLSALRQTRLAKSAIFLIALLQFAIAVAPHTGSYSDATLNRSHLHAAGDRLELAHDETACPACSGAHLTAHVAKPAHVHFVPVTATVVGDVERAAPRAFAILTSIQSRAPPSVV